MNNIDLAAQLKKPHGEYGKEVGANLYITNRVYIESVVDIMDIGQDDSILEIGPGTGLHLKYMLDKEPDISYTGIDLSELMVDEANRLNQDLLVDGRIGFYYGSSEELEFADNSFDIVLTLNTIYFMDEIDVHMKEIYRVLKPGGRFYLGFFTRNFLNELPFAQDFYKYEQNEAIELLERNGFAIEDIHTENAKSTGVNGEEMNKESVFIKALKNEEE
jgi:ubiquinone/menaquinone biosynthesis C-methylase UbiE